MAITSSVIDQGRVPLIIFKRDVFIEMMAMCRATEGELGWHGMVEVSNEKLHGDITGRIIYTITECWLPEQELATSSTCEIFPTEWHEHLQENDRWDDCCKIRFWAHSHHKMGVEPSSQDQAQGLASYTVLTDDDLARRFYLAAIFSHKGEINIMHYDGRTGVCISHCPYLVGDRGEIEALVNQITTALPHMSRDMAWKLALDEINATMSKEIDDMLVTMKPKVAAKLLNQQKPAVTLAAGSAPSTVDLTRLSVDEINKLMNIIDKQDARRDQFGRIATGRESKHSGVRSVGVPQPPSEPKGRTKSYVRNQFFDEFADECSEMFGESPAYAAARKVGYVGNEFAPL